MTERIRVPMICSCSGDGKTEGHSLLDEVKERLSRGSEELMPRDVDDGNLLTCVVQSLSMEYNAHITRIGCDQWSSVTAETYDGQLAIRVECDRVEHGVAAIWKAFADR